MKTDKLQVERVINEYLKEKEEIIKNKYKFWVIQQIKERIKDLEALIVVSKGLNKDAEVFILECRLLELKELIGVLEK